MDTRETNTALRHVLAAQGRQARLFRYRARVGRE